MNARRVLIVGNGGIALELVHALLSTQACQVMIITCKFSSRLEFRVDSPPLRVTRFYVGRDTVYGSQYHCILAMLILGKLFSVPLSFQAGISTATVYTPVSLTCGVIHYSSGSGGVVDS